MRRVVCDDCIEDALYLIKPVREESVKEMLQKVQKNLARCLHEKEKPLIYSWRGKSDAIPYEKIAIPESGDMRFPAVARRGSGFATIKEAAKRLDGEIFCYTENGDFILDVMISCGVFPNSG